MNSLPQYATASELRDVFNVMEERSYPGLDNESANRMRELLRRKIADRENTSATKRQPSVAVAVEKAELSA